MLQQWYVKVWVMKIWRWLCLSWHFQTLWALTGRSSGRSYTWLAAMLPQTASETLISYTLVKWIMFKRLHLCSNSIDVASELISTVSGEKYWLPVFHLWFITNLKKNKAMNRFLTKHYHACSILKLTFKIVICSKKSVQKKEYNTDNICLQKTMTNSTESLM